MTQTDTSLLEHEMNLPRIRTITMDHPWQWLAKGWRDLSTVPSFSLSYGAIFVIISYLLAAGLINENLFFIIPPLSAGFFLVAPLLGIGLYQISASLERGEKVEFCQAWKAWQRNDVHLAAMGVVLLLLLIAWMLAAILVFALLYTKPIPTWERFIPEVFLSGDSPLFLFTGIGVGGLFAAFTFSIAAVSTPLLMDRQIDVVSAMKVSMEAVKTNWKPMMLWAALIAMFVGVGLLSFFLGLFVTMPLVGHATWYAYRDLIESDN